MLTKKLVPSFFLVFFLFSCSSNVIFEKPKEIIFEEVKESSASVKPSSSSGVTVSPSPSPSPSVSVGGTNPTPTSSLSPTPTPSVILLKTKYNISGKVYDRFGKVISSATVFVTNDLDDLSPSYKSSDVQTNTSGAFIVSNVSPDHAKLYVVAKKASFSTSVIEIINNNQSVDDRSVEFKSDNALIDEPFASLKINNTEITSPGDDFNPPTGANNLALGNLDEANLSLNFIFSELVDQDTVENSLELISESIDPSDPNSSQIYNSASGIFNFGWSEPSGHSELNLTFKSSLEKSSNSSETKYRLYFKGKFKDSDGKYSIAGKSIKYSQSLSTDYFLFSIRN